MEPMSQREPGGNTKTPGKSTRKPCGTQYYRWQFTLKATLDDPNDPVGIKHNIGPESIFKNLVNFCKEFYYQLEEGADGYLHYQGCFSLINKHRMNEVKNIIGWNNVHLEKALNWHALKNYCVKHESRVKGPWSHNTKWIKILEELAPWQEGIRHLIDRPCLDYRTIYWFWEPIGGIGKTQFCKWCSVALGATILRGGGLKDIAFALPDAPEIVIFDLPRTLEDRVNYEAIESVKDGMIFCAKYESKMKIFNSPHVVIFANFQPDRNMLSKDRWHIVRLRV